MPTPIVMPKLGMSMEEGTVVTWTAAAGQHVEKGVTVLVIESEKAEIEIEATTSGYFRHVYVDEGETVPCGTLLAALAEAPDEEFDADAFQAANQPDVIVSSTTRVAGADSAASPAPATAASPAPASPGSSTGRRAGAPVTPAARKIAKQLGVDATQVPGTGPGGRVTREDVEAWAARREGLVETAPGVSLEVQIGGPEAAPRVLLLPGFGTDTSGFARQTPLLAESRRVLAINPRGVSLSDAPETERYDVRDLANDAAVIADGPVDVVGVSLGSAVAIEMAIAHPERVRSLTLITPFIEAEPRLLAVLEVWCDLAATVAPDALGRALLPWLFSPTTLADERACARTVRGLAAIAERVPAATLVRTLAGLRAWSETRSADLAKLDVPTCVIAAGEDLLTPASAAIASAIPGASCIVIPGAGHAVALEAPDAVNEAITAHLAL